MTWTQSEVSSFRTVFNIVLNSTDIYRESIVFGFHGKGFRHTTPFQCQKFKKGKYVFFFPQNKSLKGLNVCYRLDYLSLNPLHDTFFIAKMKI